MTLVPKAEFQRNAPIPTEQGGLISVEDDGLVGLLDAL
jgi:hypothetical protein